MVEDRYPSGDSLRDTPRRLLFSKILAQPLDSILQHRNRFWIGKAHMLRGAVVAEVQSGSNGNASLFKQVPTELIAVGCEALTVCIDIEGTFRCNRYVEA